MTRVRKGGGGREDKGGGISSGSWLEWWRKNVGRGNYAIQEEREEQEDGTKGTTGN